MYFLVPELLIFGLDYVTICVNTDFSLKFDFNFMAGIILVANWPAYKSGTVFKINSLGEKQPQLYSMYNNLWIIVLAIHV